MLLIVHASGKFKLERVSDGTMYECDRSSNGGETQCSYIYFYVESSLGDESFLVGETVPIHQDLSDGWSMMAGILTVSELQVAHNRLFIRLYGPHESLNVFYDDFSIVEIPETCTNIILNGDFETGDLRFWRPSYTPVIDFDVSSYGAGGSNYSMMIQKYTDHGITQHLDSRCFSEGQDYLIRAKFKLLNTTDLVSGVSCDPTSRNLGDANHCPSVCIRGHGCVGNYVREAFYFNDIEGFTWNSNEFNSYESVFTFDADLAACEVSVQFFFLQLNYFEPLLINNHPHFDLLKKKIFIWVGRYLYNGRAVLIDNIEITQKNS